jgi:hypothetical protein
VDARAEAGNCDAVCARRRRPVATLRLDRARDVRFEAVIPKGTVLVAPYDAVESAEGFYCVPERYDEMESLLVPVEDRLADKYGGLLVRAASFRHRGEAAPGLTAKPA